MKSVVTGVPYVYVVRWLPRSCHNQSGVAYVQPFGVRKSSKVRSSSAPSTQFGRDYVTNVAVKLYAVGTPGGHVPLSGHDTREREAGQLGQLTPRSEERCGSKTPPASVGQKRDRGRRNSWVISRLGPERDAETTAGIC